MTKMKRRKENSKISKMSKINMKILTINYNQMTWRMMAKTVNNTLRMNSSNNNSSKISKNNQNKSNKSSKNVLLKKM